MRRALWILILALNLCFVVGCGGGGGKNPQGTGSVSVTGSISPYGIVGGDVVGNGVVSIYHAGHVGDPAFRIATIGVDSDANFQLTVPEGGTYDLRVDYETVTHALGNTYRFAGYTDEIGVKLSPPRTNLGTITL